MSVLTYAEGAVLDACREYVERFPNGIPADSIRFRVLNRANVSYDQANRALSDLVSKGRLTKPKRGYYRPADA